MKLYMRVDRGDETDWSSLSHNDAASMEQVYQMLREAANPIGRRPGSPTGYAEAQFQLG